MEFLGIDYGSKRIGLSHGNAELGLAFALPALTQKTPQERLEGLLEVIKQTAAKALVIGYPYHADGHSSAMGKEVEAFVLLLKKHCPLPIYPIDEYLSSQEAERDFKATHRPPRSLQEIKSIRNSGVIDSQAATIILQDFLDYKKSRS